MATIDITTLDYLPVSSESPAYAAQFLVVGGNDYNVDLTTAIKMSADVIPAKWLIVDNSQGGGNVFVSFGGNYQFTALPFTRDKFPLKRGLNRLTITPDANVVQSARVTISSEELADSIDNQFLIQQLVTQVTFPFGPARVVSGVQLPGDNKTSVLFQTTAGSPLTYTLVLAAFAGNAWMQYVYNEGIGPGDALRIIPSGGDLINGLPYLDLPAGYGVALMCSGVDWYATGVNSPLLLLSGTAAAPTYSFMESPQSGMWRSGPGVLDWSINGSAVAQLASTFYQVRGNANGAANTLGFVIRDTYNGGGWSPVQLNEAISFYWDDVSGVGAGIRARIGTRSNASTGSFAQIVFQTTPVTAGIYNDTLILHPNYLGDIGVVELPNGKLHFPAVASPSADPTTLDDYNEFTWTPVFQATGSTFVHNRQNGWGIKIGRTVSYGCFVSLAAAGNTAGAGGLQVAGFPYTHDNSFGVGPPLGANICTWVSLIANFMVVLATPNPGQSSFNIGGWNAGATTSPGVSNANTIVGNSSSVRFGGVTLTP